MYHWMRKFWLFTEFINTKRAFHIVLIVFLKSILIRPNGTSSFLSILSCTCFYTYYILLIRYSCALFFFLIYNLNCFDFKPQNSCQNILIWNRFSFVFFMFFVGMMTMVLWSSLMQFIYMLMNLQPKKKINEANWYGFLCLWMGLHFF